jgi:hypothetical protein
VNARRATLFALSASPSIATFADSACFPALVARSAIAALSSLNGASPPIDRRVH